MDPTEGKPSELERRTSRRTSQRVSVHNGTLGEEVDESEAQVLSVADGLRPSGTPSIVTTAADAASEYHASSSSPVSSSATLAGEPTTPPPSTSPRPRLVAGRPPSIAKPNGTGLADGNALSREPSIASSATATVPAGHDESPYEGPTGPAFPYQMYSQNVRLGRTLSVATASTGVPSEHSYTGPRGPSHPYGLYAQNPLGTPNTVQEAGMPVGIPVGMGFPGVAGNYQRRIGPDGEDIADIIGPDGHTEQLPPYTRYAEDAYGQKIEPVLQQQNLPPSPSQTVGPATIQPVLDPIPVPLPGAGGIGLATRNPEFDSVEDLNSPGSRRSLRSFTSEVSHQPINNITSQTGSDDLNEKETKEKGKPLSKWQLLARRKCCGIIPYWAILLSLTTLVCAAAIGATVGIFAAKHRKPVHHDDLPPDVTVTVDATPIPTPSDLPALPTGTFMFPVSGQSGQGNNACFNDTTQSNAWSCALPMWVFSRLMLGIFADPITPNGFPYNLTVTGNESATMENDVFYYGAQVPVISSPVTLQLVNDTGDPTRGPAWFQMLPYNKTVIVRETDLSLPSAAATPTPAQGSKLRRGGVFAPGVHFGSAFGHRKVVAQAGEKPWVCTWPDTQLEIFIYVYQNSSSSITTTAPGGPQPTPTPAGPAYIPPWAGGPMATPTGGPTPTSTGAGPSSTYDGPPLPPAYPRVVKVEERRYAPAPQATCIQYQLKPDGSGLSSEPIVDQNGNPIQIVIAERESAPPVPAGQGQSRRDLYAANLFARDASLSDCGCCWFVS